MITLAYPGEWMTVALTAETVKRHLWELYKRYTRTWSEQHVLVCDDCGHEYPEDRDECPGLRLPRSRATTTAH